MMAVKERWYFSKEALKNTPSVLAGMDADKELSYRQQAANLIQDMGQKLEVTQLCINTAIVYMHRFYMFHSFLKFPRNSIAQCAIFLAAKVEEQPRKLEHVIRIAHMLLHNKQDKNYKPLDVKTEQYDQIAHELVINENILLQTLGFDIAIDHPHTYVVTCCQNFKAGRALAQTSYFMATQCLHLTTMCLQYKPTVLACVCIHLALKWSNFEIPRSSEGKVWYNYVDPNISLEQIEELTSEFLSVLQKCPSRLRRKILSENSEELKDIPNSAKEKLFPKDDIIMRKTPSKQKEANVKAIAVPTPSSSTTIKPASSDSHQLLKNSPSPIKVGTKRESNQTDLSTPASRLSTSSAGSGGMNSAPNPPEKRETLSYSAYKEKKEKERLAAAAAASNKPVVKLEPGSSLPSISSSSSSYATGKMMEMKHQSDNRNSSQSSLKQAQPQQHQPNVPPPASHKLTVRSPSKLIKQELLDKEKYIKDRYKGLPLLPPPPSSSRNYEEGSNAIMNHSNYLNSKGRCFQEGQLEKKLSFSSTSSLPSVMEKDDLLHSSRSGSGVKVKMESSPKDLGNSGKKELIGGASSRDLKIQMEFSDNDSNGSGKFNLLSTSFPSLGRDSNSNMGISSESDSNIGRNSNASAPRTSGFMSIFTNSEPSVQPMVPSPPSPLSSIIAPSEIGLGAASNIVIKKEFESASSTRQQTVNSREEKMAPGKSGNKFENIKTEDKNEEKNGEKESRAHHSSSDSRHRHHRHHRHKEHKEKHKKHQKKKEESEEERRKRKNEHKHKKHKRDKDKDGKRCDSREERSEGEGLTVSSMSGESKSPIKLKISKKKFENSDESEGSEKMGEDGVPKSIKVTISRSKVILGDKKRKSVEERSDSPRKMMRSESSNPSRYNSSSSHSSVNQRRYH